MSVSATEVEALPATSNVAISAIHPGAIAFHDGIRTVLRFEPDGRVFVRVELVDSNLEIYEAFKAWLERVL